MMSDERFDTAIANQEANTNPHRRRKAVQIKVHLAPQDAARVDAQAVTMGLERSAWVGALVRRRVRGAPTFIRSDELTLIAVLTELRRIAVGIGEIIRAMNAASRGEINDLERAYLEDLRTEIRGHMRAIVKSFEGNLAYWRTDT